jgi:hypothetical protein
MAEEGAEIDDGESAMNDGRAVAILFALILASGFMAYGILA